jgi:hypothetical protein
MSRWIYQLRQERNEEKQRQKHYAEVFPPLAGALWVQLCDTIQGDLQRIRKEFPELITEHTQVTQQSRSLRVDYKDQFPHYLLGLTVNIPEQTLTVQQIRFDSPSAPPRGVQGPELDTVLIFSLNEEEQRMQLLLEGEVISLEKFSEICLRPLIDLHPVDVFTIVSDRFVSS